MDIRNVAIIAHVDHGKTTLIDGLLKQSKTFRENEAAMAQTLILDSSEQERERGITILAKNTAITYRNVKINIIDTPGHADFGGEVERTLNMADGALLVIDAQEGPMPQTRFVLKKALELGLQLIVVINKIDKRAAQVEKVTSETHDLFLEVATHETQLEFPVYYAIGREGKAWAKLPENPTEHADLTPLFEAMLHYVPAPRVEKEKPFQLLVTTLDWDDFQGKYAIGRIARGRATPGRAVALLTKSGRREDARIERVYVSQGLKRIEVPSADAGDIVALTGISAAHIGDTIADVSAPEALPTIAIAEPTVTMSIGSNTSPLAGREGQFVTSRQLLDRILKELETNVSLRFEERDGNEHLLSGRGELHLAVFLENLRREGFEFHVGKPRVIMKRIEGQEMEPLEELVIDVEKSYSGAVMGEVGKRRGVLISQTDNPDGSMRLVFIIPTRGLLGFRSQLLTLSRGTGLMSSQFLRYEPMGAALPRLRNGVLIASDSGKAVAYGLNVAQGRGSTFIGPQTDVYEGMIVGLNSREEDIEVNVTKEKRLSNMRASGSDEAIQLTPPTIMSLEQSLDFLEDNEFLEITPKSLRLRKKLLTATERAKVRRAARDAD
ncbi:MAG: GTP-binding protein [Parcubacteria group bacterium Gr01-1014_38]|nr:MAG: GTP-binding protein [Parcubacteria group bacterium Gr01-1014_38]